MTASSEIINELYDLDLHYEEKDIVVEKLKQKYNKEELLNAWLFLRDQHLDGPAEYYGCEELAGLLSKAANVDYLPTILIPLSKAKDLIQIDLMGLKNIYSINYSKLTIKEMCIILNLIKNGYIFYALGEYRHSIDIDLGKKCIRWNDESHETHEETFDNFGKTWGFTEDWRK